MASHIYFEKKIEKTCIKRRKDDKEKNRGKEVTKPMVEPLFAGKEVPGLGNQLSSHSLNINMFERD